MTPATASHWEDLKLAQIDDEELAGLILKIAIKFGGAQAVRLLQETLNRVAQWKGDWIPVDGKICQMTIAMANQLPANDVIQALSRMAKQAKAA